MSNELKPLILGDLEIKVPIVQGGMGIKVSTASLAVAVANYGGVGTIASVGLGYGSPHNETDFPRASREGLEAELRQAKAESKGIVGVNILVALSNYEDLARTSVREGADFIVSGAGLPLRLPEFTEGSSLKVWRKRYNRLPDALVVEGPFAGGHLGFKLDYLREHKENNLEALVREVLELTSGYQKENGVSIPVIAAGGIFDGVDIARFLKLGAAGVQLATRFVVTQECSVAQAFKDTYLKAKEEDVFVIESPVGLPGRVIKTKFIERMMRGEKIPVRCGYRCLKACNPKTAPYCIAKALFDAVRGDLDNAVVFAGSNVARLNKIVSVKELMDELVSETLAALDKPSVAIS